MAEKRAATVHILPGVVQKRICNKCGDDKPLKDFRPRPGAAGDKGNTCYKCHNLNPVVIAGRRKYVETARGRYQKARFVARERELEFFLSLEAYSALVSQPCYYCKGKLGQPVKRGCGLDRLNSRIGYVTGNVVSCCGICNRMKSDWMTPEETLIAVEAILQFRAKR